MMPLSIPDHQEMGKSSDNTPACSAVDDMVHNKDEDKKGMLRIFKCSVRLTIVACGISGRRANITISYVTQEIVLKVEGQVEGKTEDNHLFMISTWWASLHSFHLWVWPLDYSQPQPTQERSEKF
ncbi:hypothetical protein GQX74_014827 [Glossina fuscipes]|nr:hypothetical protein GQX74_014827 [Glossina fuscipes]